MESVMFTVYGLNCGHRFAFTADSLDVLKSKLDSCGMSSDGDTYAILQDGKPFQLWVGASYVLIRDTYKGMDGYQGWFPMTRRKWDSQKGEYSQETYRFPVAIFTDGVGHINADFGRSHQKEVEVDGSRYIVQSVCGNDYVFTPDWEYLGDFMSLSDSDGWYKVIHSVRKPTPSTYLSPEKQFYPIGWRYGDRRDEIKWAGSEKGAVRLIVKLVNTFAEVAAQ